MSSCNNHCDFKYFLLSLSLLLISLLDPSLLQFLPQLKVGMSYHQKAQALNERKRKRGAGEEEERLNTGKKRTRKLKRTGKVPHSRTLMRLYLRYQLLILTLI